MFVFFGCVTLIRATWPMRPTKYLASAGVLIALGAIAPLWVWFQRRSIRGGDHRYSISASACNRLRRNLDFSARIGRLSWPLCWRERR
jgi:hypothetical protein